MKNFMKMVKFYYDWHRYKQATSEDKICYMMAQEKGMRCVGMRQGLANFYFKYDPTQPPQEKNWLEWEDYKRLWHPYTGEYVLNPPEPKPSLYEEMMAELQDMKEESIKRMKEFDDE